MSSSFIIERCRSLCEETEVLEKMVMLLFDKLPRDSVTSLVIETAIRQLGRFGFRKLGLGFLLTREQGKAFRTIHGRYFLCTSTSLGGGGGRSPT